MVLGIPPAALCWSTRALGRAVRVMAEERAAFFQVSPGELSQQSPARRYWVSRDTWDHHITLLTVPRGCRCEGMTAFCV